MNGRGEHVKKREAASLMFDVLESREKIACVNKFCLLRGLGVNVGQQAQQFSFAGNGFLKIVDWVLDLFV